MNQPQLVTLTKSADRDLLRLRSFADCLRCCFFLFLVFIAGSVQAQVTASLPDTAIERKLVELALNGPEMKETQHQNLIDQYQLRNAKNQWMNLLTLSFNYNDLMFRNVQPVAGYQYPKFFFGLNIPLGTLLSRTQVKSAREQVQIGQLRQEELRRQLKMEVLTKYRQYKAQSELIALETGQMNDLEAALTEARDKFRKNLISFDTYNTIQDARNAEQAKIINLKLQQAVLELDIERIIGTDLENVVI